MLLLVRVVLVEPQELIEHLSVDLRVKQLLSGLYQQAVAVVVDVQQLELQMGLLVPMHQLKVVPAPQQEMVEVLAIFGMLTTLVSQAPQVTPSSAVLLSMQ
jgi:hypothetical protein